MAGDFTRTIRAWPGSRVPAALVNAPPAIEYSPFSMLIGVVVLMPVRVTLAEFTQVSRVASVLRPKLNASGVVSAANVVATNEPVTVPTVSAAFTAVENWVEVVSRTVTCWLLVIVPAAAVYAAPSIEYSPLVMLIGVTVLMPVMVTLLDTSTTLRAVLLPAVKLNASG